jgi:hypothetical protein
VEHDFSRAVDPLRVSACRQHREAIAAQR